MISVPFEISEVHAGFSEARGIMRLEDDFLVFQVQVVTMGLFKRSPETIKIEFGAIDEVRLEKRLVSDRVYIRPRRLRFLEVMPGKHAMEVRLKVKRKHRTRALLLVDSIRRRKGV
jgi:hypothetical protein